MPSPPTISIKIHAYSFDIPAPYAEGHPLTEVEATALNGLRAENIRNNVARWVPRPGEPLLEHEVLAALRDRITGYAQGYAFGTKRPSVSTLSPLESLARDVALERVDQLEAESDRRVVGEAREAMITKLAATPAVAAEAQRRLEVLREIAEGGLEGL